MKNIINERPISKGAKIGKYAIFGGLGFLLVGLIVSWAYQDSPLLWVSFLCLLFGVLLSSIGTMNLNRWARQPRADQALAQGFKGYDDRWRLYQYWLPAPHVLLSPMGLFVLTPMGQDGAIRFEDGKFQRAFSAIRLLRFMAEEGLGRPFAEADAQVAALQKFLEAHGVDQEVEIQNMLVFYNPLAKLTVSDAPRPITDARGLKKALRKMPLVKFPDDLYEQLVQLFDAQVSQP